MDGATAARQPLSALPVIDISPFVAGGSEAARAGAAAAVRHAAIDIGFFYITGHGIPETELDVALALGHRFFALPNEVKLRWRAGPGVALGYHPLNDGAPDQYGRRADVKERFSVAREPVPGEPERGRFGAGQSHWPEETALPGFTAFFKHQIERRMRLTRALAQGFALSLGLPQTHFDAAFAGMGCVLMFNRYPRLGLGAAPAERWSFSPHTDYGAFTILQQDALSGLEVRNSAGQWIAAPPLGGAFLVNIGDMFAMWTNDLYVSTLHRVVNANDAARLSLAFFTYPHGLTEIRCLETCAGPGNPPRYAPVLAEDYHNRLVEAAHRTGRPGIAQRTAERLGAAGNP